MLGTAAAAAATTTTLTFAKSEDVVRLRRRGGRGVQRKRTTTTTTKSVLKNSPAAEEEEGEKNVLLTKKKTNVKDAFKLEPNEVALYDTTLRDGTQQVGMSLTLDDKLAVSKRLKEIGVRFIEGGYPGSNPKDAKFFEDNNNDSNNVVNNNNTFISAFGMAGHQGVSVEQDAGLQAMLIASAGSVYGCKGIRRTVEEKVLDKRWKKISNSSKDPRISSRTGRMSS